MSEEAKDGNVATETAEKPQGAATAPVEGSAPQSVKSAEGEGTKPNASGTANEPQPKTPTQAKGGVEGDKPLAPKDYIKLRKRAQEAEKRVADTSSAYESRIKALEERLEKLNGPAHQPQQQTASEDLSFLDNPGAWLDAELNKRLTAVQQQTQLEREADEAGNWLSKRSHVSQDGAFAREVAALLAEGGRYHALSNQDPMTAAESAYNSVCRQKGINPDWGAVADPGGAKAAMAAGGIGKPTPGGSGPKTYTRQEIAAMMNGLDPRSAEYMKRADEIDRAAKEGRIVL